jgi:hypothetical protein
MTGSELSKYHVSHSKRNGKPPDNWTDDVGTGDVRFRCEPIEYVQSGTDHEADLGNELS